MRLGYGLNLEQSQKLIMTPQLRQAIAILQLTALELTNYVEEQLLENPLLEVKEEFSESGSEEADTNKDKDASTEVGDEPAWEMDWEEYFQKQEERGTREFEPSQTEERRFEPFIAAGSSLQEHLIEQIHVQKIAVPMNLAEYIIGNLDDNGYLTISLEEIARERKQPLELVEGALQIVQGLDPLGIGARSLKECLMLQLPLLDTRPPKIEEFLDYLEDFAAGRLQKIANKLKLTTIEVQNLGDLVRTLDPKPGCSFPSSGEARYIVPDIVVEEIGGEFIILVNDISVPRLCINQTYRNALSQDKQSEVRKFVEDKLNSASWLIRSIEQRRTTLYKVANAIVKRQEEFLRRGIWYLKPLTMKEIAQEVGVHESTVSRATANKYVQTPRGLYEFKFFFASGIGYDQGMTSNGIKEALKLIIDEEDPKNPYSDQKLTVLLKNRGMTISRRTVAKYRDELGIPSTTIRKRY